MSDYGVTSTGFTRKRLDLLLQELNSEILSIFGENFNVSPESPDGQVNGVISESQANLWEIAELAYNAFNPNSATGVTLSNLVLLNYISRQPATSTKTTLLITGSPSTVIPAGSVVRNQAGTRFSTDLEVVIGLGGTVEVGATALQTGPIISVQNTITQIDTPISGWASVTNPEDAIPGTNEETDVELRARRARSTARTARNLIDALEAEILAVTGVSELFIYENTGLVTDAFNTEPKGFQCVVLGGDDTAIATAIFNKKPVGITASGTTTVQISDSQGINHDIGFTRPTPIDIYVKVLIKKFSNYPVNGDSIVKSNIVDYAAGNLIEGRGFGVGGKVVQSELYSAVNLVKGHSISEIYIGLAPSPVSSANIPLAFDEISRFDINNIEIEEIP